MSPALRPAAAAAHPLYETASEHRGQNSALQVNNEGDRRIEQRAQELAEIRGSGSYTQEDLAEAARELRGHSLPVSSPEDDVAETGLARDPSDPAANTGHHVPDMPADDENEASARLAQEGVDEAQHDLMLAARRRRENP